MKTLRLLAGAVSLMALSIPLLCQPTPTTGYHQVQCIKIKPDKGPDFRKWAEGDLHKFAQALVDSGRYSSWSLARAVMPAGSAITCDYYIVGVYPGLPPEPLGPEGLGAILKKAGVSATAEEFAKSRDSMATLVSNGMWQNQVLVGSMQKGDYLMVNEFKVPNLDDWASYTKKIWQPLAEQMNKDGATKGWSLNQLVMPPRGSGIPVNGVTLDVYSSWDQVFKPDAEFVNRWRKVHPDMELGTTFEQFGKLADFLSAHLYKLDDMVGAAK